MKPLTAWDRQWLFATRALDMRCAARKMLWHRTRMSDQCAQCIAYNRAVSWIR